MGGDFFLGAVLSGSVTKLLLRLNADFPNDEFVKVLRPEVKSSYTDLKAMLLMTELLMLGRTQSSNQIDEDSFERIMICLKVCDDLNGNGKTKNIFLENCRQAFAKIIQELNVHNLKLIS